MNGTLAWGKRGLSPVILLNPLHPGFAKIEIGDPREFITDLRLIRK